MWKFVTKMNACTETRINNLWFSNMCWDNCTQRKVCKQKIFYCHVLVFSTHWYTHFVFLLEYIYIIYILNLERIHRKQAHPKTGFVMFIRWLRLFHFLCVLGLQLELLLTLSVYASSAFKSYSKDTIFSDVNINVILLNIFSNYNKAHRCYDSSDLYICI